MYFKRLLGELSRRGRAGTGDLSVFCDRLDPAFHCGKARLTMAESRYHRVQAHPALRALALAVPEEELDLMLQGVVYIDCISIGKCPR